MRLYKSLDKNLILTDRFLIESQVQKHLNFLPSCLRFFFSIEEEAKKAATLFLHNPHDLNIFQTKWLIETCRKTGWKCQTFC